MQQIKQDFLFHRAIYPLTWQ